MKIIDTVLSSNSNILTVVLNSRVNNNNIINEYI